MINKQSLCKRDYIFFNNYDYELVQSNLYIITISDQCPNKKYSPSNLKLVFLFKILEVSLMGIVQKYSVTLKC